MTEVQKLLIEMSAGESAVIKGHFVLKTKDGRWKTGSDTLNLPEAVEAINGKRSSEW
jgi:hypothetical protein